MTPFKTCPKICLPLWKFTGVLYHVGVALAFKKKVEEIYSWNLIHKASVNDLLYSFIPKVKTN